MPDNDDMFAPPSKDELNSLFSPPSKEELASLQGIPAPSDTSVSTKDKLAAIDKQSSTQDKIAEIKKQFTGDKTEELSPEMTAAQKAGLIQGGTFGFSTDIGAAGDIAKDVITGKQGLTGLPAKWREYQQSRQAANKVLQEQSPGEYGTGELAGGVLASMALPELGGAKLLSLAGKAAPGAEAFLAGQGGSLAAKLAGKAAAGAIEGAPAGALYGAGMSDSDISQPGKLASDAASGAAMGSLTGAALGLGVQGAKSALGAASDIGGPSSDIDYARKLKAAYGYGEKGIDLSSSRGKDTAALLATKHLPNQIVDRIMSVDSQLGQDVGSAIQTAQDAGTKINIDPELAQSTKNLFGTFVDNPTLMDLVDPKSKAVIDLIYRKGAGDMTPIEAKALKDTLYNLSDKLQGISGDVSSIAQRQGTNLARTLDQSLKAQIPEYADAASKFAHFRQSIPETILQPGVPGDKRTAYMGDLKNKEGDLLAATRQMFGSAQMPGAPVTAGPRAGLKELQQNLQSLGRTNPEAVEGLGGSPQDVYQGWRNKADQMAMIKQSQGVDPSEGLKRSLVGQIVGSGEGLGLNIANKVGRAVKTAGQSGPVQMGTKLYSAGNDQLMGLAQTLKGSQATEMVGSALEKALNNKTDITKNAILFRMLQDPTYRGMMKEAGFDSEEGK